MARKKDQDQPELIPLSEEEIADIQHTLPKTTHAGKRAKMKDERKDLQERINNMAQQLRSQGR